MIETFASLKEQIFLIGGIIGWLISGILAILHFKNRVEIKTLQEQLRNEKKRVDSLEAAREFDMLAQKQMYTQVAMILKGNADGMKIVDRINKVYDEARKESEKKLVKWKQERGIN